MKDENRLRKFYSLKVYDPLTGHLEEVYARQHLWMGKESDLICGMPHWRAGYPSPIPIGAETASPPDREQKCGGKYGQQTKQRWYLEEDGNNLRWASTIYEPSAADVEIPAPAEYESSCSPSWPSDEGDPAQHPNGDSTSS